MAFLAFLAFLAPLWAADPPPFIDELPEPPAQSINLPRGTPYIGISLGPFEEGVMAPFVYPKSPASLAGIKNNDVFVKVGEADISGTDVLIERIRAHRYGEAAVVTMRREKTLIRGPVMIKGSEMKLEEERADGYAAEIVGAVKGTLIAPEWTLKPEHWAAGSAPKTLAGRQVLVIGWGDPAREVQALEWLAGVSRLASASLVVMGWNGSGQWSDVGKQWLGNPSRPPVLTEPFDRWGKEFLIPSDTVWCYVMDGRRIKGFLTLEYRDFLAELGQWAYGVRGWRTQLEQAWLTLNGLEIADLTPEEKQALKDAASGVRILRAPNFEGGVQLGDIVIRVEGVPVGQAGDFLKELKAYAPGSLLNVDVIRQGKIDHAKLKLKGL